jgi:hypothetical protein
MENGGECQHECKQNDLSSTDLKNVTQKCMSFNLYIYYILKLQMDSYMPYENVSPLTTSKI